MKNQNSRLLTLYRIILTIGSLFSVYLIINDVLFPPYCPKLIIVPACYPTLFNFTIPLIFTFFEFTLEKYITYTALLLGTATAIYFTLGNIIGYSFCPTLVGIPLCYVALLTYIVLIYLRVKIKKIQFLY